MTKGHAAPGPRCALHPAHSRGWTTRACRQERPSREKYDAACAARLRSRPTEKSVTRCTRPHAIARDSPLSDDARRTRARAWARNGATSSARSFHVLPRVRGRKLELGRSRVRRVRAAVRVSGATCAFSGSALRCACSERLTQTEIARRHSKSPLSAKRCLASIGMNRYLSRAWHSQQRPPG